MGFYRVFDVHLRTFSLLIRMEIFMMDVVYLGLVLLFGALSYGFVAGCQQLGEKE